MHSTKSGGGFFRVRLENGCWFQSLETKDTVEVTLRFTHSPCRSTIYTERCEANTVRELLKAHGIGSEIEPY